MSNPKLTRRQLLKAGASSAVLALVGGRGASASDAEITSAAIHPAIGIARIGNSSSGYYVGPELPGTVPLASHGFKDASGAIKRQAAPRCGGAAADLSYAAIRPRTSTTDGRRACAGGHFARACSIETTDAKPRALSTLE